MDLSHLVTIGLYGARRAPLSAADLDYFRKHDLEDTLADIVSQLAKDKPADPYRFIVEAISQKSGTAPAAPKPAAAKTATPAAATAKTAPPAAAASKEKAGSTGGGGGGLSAAENAELEKLKTQIAEKKKALKDSGMSGGQINKNEEVCAMVARLQDLKTKEGAGGGAAPAQEPKAKKEAAAPAPAKEKKEKGKEKAAAPAAAPKAAAPVSQTKGGGLTISKSVDVPGWYEQVMTKCEMIQEYPVKGCFTLRPWSYRIWELVQRWFDTEIKKVGVENCYFPMFIPKCYLFKEEKHLDDFKAEVAWVTKFSDEDLDEPVAIRPTSETAMYDAYSNWVQSHRDLPIKLNQWCSVVRWEVKQTTPFLRTREFLWQEGHTAFADRESACKEVRHILELYAGIYEHLLALPVVRGTKTKAETFPGADFTMTVEAFIPATGRAIQGATSHHLGQNFSKMFEIDFQDPNDPTGKKREFAYQNSWGVTQRTIGVMTMVHGDDKGLVLPPRVAGFQVVLVQVGVNAKTTDQEKQLLEDTTDRYLSQLQEAGIRVKHDDRKESPGWKFNYWEMKGVPVRIELGLKDIANKTFVMAKRNVPDPKAAKVTGNDATMVADVQRVLDQVQDELYAKALAERDARLTSVDDWKDFSRELNQGKLIMVPYCGHPECEEEIKEKSKEEAQDEESVGGLKMGAKGLCVPIEEKYNIGCPAKCIAPWCTRGPYDGTWHRTMFGRSY